jgi:hypothetical protein
VAVEMVVKITPLLHLLVELLILAAEEGVQIIVLLVLVAVQVS